MKRQTTRILAVVLALALWVLPASAQKQGRQMSMRADTTMQSGMMMMNNPLVHAAMMVHLLPSMQQKLNLSEDQVQRLRGMEETYQDRRQALVQQMQEHKQQMQRINEGEQPEPADVRSMLREGAENHADMMALAYETAADMRGVLTDAQRQQLEQTSHAEMHKHMMSNMTMMDMMQAMQGMRMMQCPMMSGMQRGGEMMQGMGMMHGNQQGMRGMQGMMPCMMMGDMMN